MKKIAPIFAALMMSSMVFGETTPNLIPKGFHDCEHAAYGQAEMFVYTENNHTTSNHSFTLIPNNTTVKLGYVPFTAAGYKNRIDFSKKKHIFQIKHSGYYKVSYFLKCYTPDSSYSPVPLNIGIRILDKKNKEKNVFAFHKLFFVAIPNSPYAQMEISDQCICRLYKGDKVGLYVFNCPDEAPTYYNEGNPEVIPDTAASLSIFKAETD